MLFWGQCIKYGIVKLLDGKETINVCRQEWKKLHEQKRRLQINTIPVKMAESVK